MFLIGFYRPILISFSALGTSFTLSGSVWAFFFGFEAFLAVGLGFSGAFLAISA